MKADQECAKVFVAFSNDSRHIPNGTEWKPVQFQAPPMAVAPLLCSYCGEHHHGLCSRIKVLEYFDNGSVKRVEFHEPR